MAGLTMAPRLAAQDPWHMSPDAMPRWNMNPADLNDLIAYLKQAHNHD